MKALPTIELAALYGAVIAGVIAAIGLGVDFFRYGLSPKLDLWGELFVVAWLIGFSALLGAFLGAAFGVILAGVRKPGTRR